MYWGKIEGMARKQTTVALTLAERRIVEKAKNHYEDMFGHRISWGLFLVTLSLGVLSARDIVDFAIACPYCNKVIQALPQRVGKSALGK